MRVMKKPQVEMLSIPFDYLRVICKWRTCADDCKYPAKQGKGECGCAEADACPIWSKRPTPWIRDAERSFRRYKTSEEVVPW